MRKLLYFFGIVIVSFSIWSCKSNSNNPGNNREIVDENDTVQIMLEVVDSAKDEFDVPVVALWIRNKFTGEEKKLLQTVRPTSYSWYVSDGDKWSESQIDSISAIYKVLIIKNTPLRLLVEGCPDLRNAFSYIIDVNKRTARYIPANNGYVAGTEEGYMIFRSYRYVSDPDIAGRYTLLQIFDEDGEMVDALDLEHVTLEKRNSPYAKKRPDNKKFLQSPGSDDNI